jgi:large subunit ribosomal protein L15
MKLHDLRPAEGSHRARTRVGRGIAAGKGKTAGRGTKGQKARAGGSIPPWFEGGQTPLHQRIPKLRGFRNRFKIAYEVVNVGRIAELVAAGRLEAGGMPGAKSGRGGRSASAPPVTVNQEILRATGLVSRLSRPLKILGSGDVDVPLFVVADAFTKSAVTKIEAAGGSIQVLEAPVEPTTALGVEPAPAVEPPPEPEATPVPVQEIVGEARPARPRRSAAARKEPSLEPEVADEPGSTTEPKAPARPEPAAAEAGSAQDETSADTDADA